MKLTTIISSLAIALAPFASAINVSYDTVYDKKATSLTKVACSDGSNGLITKGYTTFGSLPKFPYIGGAPAVTGWNSAGCGTCWKLTYKNKSINVLAIDVAKPDFNIALTAMNDLTGGQATQLGRVPITATQVAASVCGL